ncbi:MAG: hypothetical protein IJS73_04150 [Paludibacteraceae bacterium]|nr:hypothetical protein [Paludibacteraceae bacterium]
MSNDDAVFKEIMKLCGIVIHRHFSGYSEEIKEDLISEGVVKAYQLINSGYYDKEKGSLTTFLYTGIRNAMGNFLYHYNKNVYHDYTVIEETEAVCDNKDLIVYRDFLERFLRENRFFSIDNSVIDIFEKYGYDFSCIVDVYPNLRSFVTLFLWEIKEYG